jgi:peptidoglycan/xylan/chitin deacetylase (PgdA/CDA1 family)
MTFRVWPPWVKLVLVLLLVVAAAIVVVIAGFDPFGDDEKDRRAGWSAHPTQLPILMYHHFDELGSGEGRFAVNAAQFTEQLTWLQAEGYTTITISDYLAALAGAPLPERPVMLTIDDGFADQWGFAAILRDHGMVANFLLPNAATLSHDQIQALSDVGEIGGHTVSHPFLSELSPDEQAAEIRENRAWLRDLTGDDIVAFAYPYGDYDEATTSLLAEAGYQLAFDAWGGLAPIGAEVNRWHVPRIEIGDDDSLDVFAAKLAGAGL